LTRFGRRQLVAFLRALDRHLQRPAAAVVIGGAAAAVAYDADSKTADIDVYGGMSKAISQAAEVARRESGHAIAVAAVTIADLPIRAPLRAVRGAETRRTLEPAGSERRPD
jgi:hypothetical protein